MQLSPLQLLEYAFDGISIMPIEGYTPEDNFSPKLVFFPGKLAMSADTNLTLLADKEKYSDFGLRLTVRVGPKEDGDAPYRVEVAIRGVVRMHLTQVAGQTEERRVLALVNGVSLLYGVVREMIANTTTRSVHGQMLLPSLNFSDLASRKPDVVKKAVKITSKKIARTAKKVEISKVNVKK